MNIFKILNIGGRLGFVNRAQKTIVSAAFVLGVSSGLSAILGMLKGRLLTSYFGVSNELSVFYTADKIPNMVYSVLVVGALSTIFIPVFTKVVHKDRKLAWETASSIITIGVATFCVLGVLVVVFATPIMELISLGKFSREEVALGASLMRIMVLAQLVLVVSSFITSILHSFKYFIIPAFAPVLYNLGMLGGIIVLSPRYGIYGPAFGVIVGALLHLSVQIPVLKKVKPVYTPVFDFKNKNVKQMFVLMPPRVLSVMSNQLVATINNSLAILVSTTSVVVFKYASQLQFFPVHLFGASMAAASLPVLSENAGSEDRNKFKKIFINTMHQTLFLVMPASMMLLILRVPVVRLVYGVDRFPWEATVKTSYALAFFSLSIFAQALVYLLTRAFYALKDTVTPVKVSLVTIVINVGLSVIFVRGMGLGIWSIALAYSIASFLDMLILLFLLSKRLGGFDKGSLLIPFTKISYATAFMGLSLYSPLKLLDQSVLDTSRTINLVVLTFIASCLGVASYLFFTKIFKVKEIELFYRLLVRLKLRDIVPAQTHELVTHTEDSTNP